MRENYFDEASAVNEYDLTLYIREDGETYRRFEEVHYQRAYDLKTIGRLLADAGMELTAAYDAFTNRSGTTRSGEELCGGAPAQVEGFEKIQEQRIRTETRKRYSI